MAGREIYGADSIYNSALSFDCEAKFLIEIRSTGREFVWVCYRALILTRIPGARF